MKAVIFKPPQGNPKVDRLVDYIYRLSKVTVEIVSWSKEPEWLPHVGKQNESFRHTAKTIDEDFVWLEPDSIPLVEDWLEQLKERWSEREKGIEGLLSTDFQSPYDMCGGIGVYTKNVKGLVPQGCVTHGFDGWLTQFQQNKIERTGLIQHSYGYYHKHKDLVERYHHFPEDNWMLREYSVIFHADKEQSIITEYDTPEKEERLTP
jgi:hypothetical protein